MCIIIVKQEGQKVSSDVIKTSARMNPHGLGIVWLDNYEVTYHKSSEYKALITDRPYIAHFRYATIGVVGRDNTHPFECGKNQDEFLMMNGTIHSLGNKQECDTKVLARSLGEVPRKMWASELLKYSCRFVTANIRKRTFQIYNKGLWHQKDGVWYSKDNVFERNYVAVYGTLKRGQGNYKNYLSDSKFIGSGETKDKYPLIVRGLPFLVDKVGVGHNVEVDVFRVSDEVMRDLDLLEGHPDWYKRKVVPVVVGKKTINCWVYFNGCDVPKGEKLHKSYNYSLSNYKPRATFQSKLNLMTEQEQQLMFEYEEMRKRKEAESMCVNCYHSLSFDGFMDYYCKACDSWFCESEIIKL